MDIDRNYLNRFSAVILFMYLMKRLSKRTIERYMIFALLSLVIGFFGTKTTSTVTYAELVQNSQSTVLLPGMRLEQSTVKEVIDGDTIELTNGQKVRYIGINTPETSHPRKGIECFGKEAKQKNKEIMEGKIIYMAKDVSETDRYDRLLRFVYLPNPHATHEALFVNQYLVEQGYAYASSYPPDISKNDIFNQAQKLAEEQNRGLWKSCEK